MQGNGVSPGVVTGPLHFFRHQDITAVKKQAEDIAAEKERLLQAQEKTIAQLEALAERCRRESGNESAILFETHAMFVADEDYVACIHTCIEEERYSAEYAVQTASEQFAAMFSAMDDT